MPQPNAPKSAHGLGLPRILCLHGGGTNSRIFRTQCRVLRTQLQSSFRLVFADAPFLTSLSPDVESVYAGWGPFRSWVTHLNASAAERESIAASVSAAIREDDEAGATGAVVGLLGFSQGARIAASLLLHQQKQQKGQHQENQKQEKQEKQQPPNGRQPKLAGATSAAALAAAPASDYRFAILLAGRGPLLSLDPALASSGSQPLLELPTIHVHGLRDIGLESHRDLFLRHCKAGSTFLVEWDGDHRVPIKSQDVAAVVAKLATVAEITGVSFEQ
jgi:pimeloyl-ACP methyl ester carboxylesterase